MTTEARAVETALENARTIIAESVKHPDWFISRGDQPRLIMAHRIETLSARIERLEEALRETLAFAQALEEHSSKGTGGRRGGQIFARARAALTPKAQP